MVIGTGLRAIKPFGSFQIKVWPYKLQGLDIIKNKSLLIFNPCSYVKPSVGVQDLSWHGVGKDKLY